MLCLLAGPARSLLTGLGVLLMAPIARGFWGVLLFWFWSAERPGGQLPGDWPFFALGDIGQSLRLLSAPSWAYWTVFFGGAVGTVLLGRFATRRRMAMTDPAVGIEQLSCAVSVSSPSY